MGSGDAVQHVFPAGLIGQFAAEESRGVRPREKAVWVARRGAQKPFRQAAKRVGFDSRVPRSYATPEGLSFDFDVVLSQSETFIGDLKQLGPRLRREPRIGAAEYVAGLIPLLAGILSRSPRLGLGDTSALSPDNPNQRAMLEERMEALAAALYLLSFGTTLMVIRDIDEGLFTNDTGYVVGPAPAGAVEVFVPINPRFAIVLLVGGLPNVDAQAPHASARCVDWNADVLDIRKWLLARHARHEAYASTQGTAQLILDRQAALDPTAPDGIPREHPFPPEAWAGFLRRNTPDPVSCLMAWFALRVAVGAPLEPSMSQLDTDTRQAFLDRVAHVSIPTRQRRPTWDELGGYTGLWRIRQPAAEEFTWAYVPTWP